jgi:DNA-binding transcriptional LysR family regulator
MHISRIDLNLFVVFKAIYERESITRAAEQLNLSQPAVSHALARLRALVEDPLFVRDGQRITPTPTAHRLIGPARLALESLERAMSELHDFDAANAQDAFTIGINSLMENALFTPLMELVSATAPRIRLASVRLERKTMERSLASGAIDLAIDVGLATGKLTHKMRVLSSQIVVVGRADHPAFSKGNVIDFEEYLDQQHVILSSRPYGPSFEDMSIARFSNAQRKIYSRCQQVGTALGLVRHSNCILTVSKFLLHGQLSDAGLKVIDAPFDSPNAEIYGYWHVNSELEKPAAWLRQALIKALNQLAAPSILPST